MGLGKTVITLTALWELALDYFEVGKVLVIAPFRVARDTWKEELEKWDHLKGLSVSVVVGSEKERLDALEKKASEMICLCPKLGQSWKRSRRKRERQFFEQLKGWQRKSEKAEIR